MLARMSWKIWFAFYIYISYRFSHVLFDQLVKAKEQQEKEYVENAKTKKSAKAKVRHKSSFFCWL
jgi:sensor domain CHASE-containing protein